MAIQKKKTAESQDAPSGKNTKTTKKTPKAAAASLPPPVRKRPVRAVQVDEEPAQITETVPTRTLSPEQLSHFHTLLLQRRVRILRDVDGMQGNNSSVNRQDSTGDLSSMPIHMADIGTDNYEQEFTLGLIESDRKTLIEIDMALTKLKEGTYGICEGTGQSIGLERLEAKPEARYCIEYARMIEKGLVKPAGDDDYKDRGDRDDDDDE